MFELSPEAHKYLEDVIELIANRNYGVRASVFETKQDEFGVVLHDCHVSGLSPSDALDRLLVEFPDMFIARKAN